MSNHKNKSIREKLEAKYGKGCMFRNADIAKRIEAMGGIKTYRQYKEEHRYKIKKIIQLEKQMTLHHLKHRSEGGPTSENNGAVVSALAHSYLHSLPRDQEEIVNNMLRDYKFKFRATTLSIGNTIELDGQEFEFDLSDCIEIPLETIPKPDKRKTKPFNRAKTKQDTRRKIDEELDWFDER